MTEAVLIALASGLMSAIAVYILICDKERQEYKAYKADLLELQASMRQALTSLYEAECNAGQALNAAERAEKEVGFTSAELHDLKQWAYGYVSYMPNLKERSDI